MDILESPTGSVGEEGDTQLLSDDGSEDIYSNMEPSRDYTLMPDETSEIDFYPTKLQGYGEEPSCPTAQQDHSPSCNDTSRGDISTSYEDPEGNWKGHEKSPHKDGGDSQLNNDAKDFDNANDRPRRHKRSKHHKNKKRRDHRGSEGECDDLGDEPGEMPGSSFSQNSENYNQSLEERIPSAEHQSDNLENHSRRYEGDSRCDGHDADVNSSERGSRLFHQDESSPNDRHKWHKKYDGHRTNMLLETDPYNGEDSEHRPRKHRRSNENKIGAVHEHSEEYRDYGSQEKRSPRSSRSPKDGNTRTSNSSRVSEDDRRGDGSDRHKKAPEVQVAPTQSDGAEDGEILEDGEIDEDGEVEEEAVKPPPAREGSDDDTNSPENEDNVSSDVEGDDQGRSSNVPRKGKKPHRKEKHDKRKKMKDDKKRKRKRPNYVDHDKVDEDAWLAMDNNRSKNDVWMPTEKNRSKDKSKSERSPRPYRSPYRSPPGPYDSPPGPYDSPPGPYDSPQEQYRTPRYENNYPSKPKRSLMTLVDDGYMDAGIVGKDEKDVYNVAGGRSRQKPKNKRPKPYMEPQAPPKKKPLLETPRPRTNCRFFMDGKCSKGSDCTFSHDFVPNKKQEICKFYLSSSCSKGNYCVYMHGDYPCKFFHTGATCYGGDNCKFSHDPLTDDTKVLLDKLFENNNEDNFDEEDQPPWPRPSLLGSPPRHMKDHSSDRMKEPTKKIPSLFDIQVFPPGQSPKKHGDGGPMHQGPRPMQQGPGMMHQGPRPHHHGPMSMQHGAGPGPMQGPGPRQQGMDPMQQGPGQMNQGQGSGPINQGSGPMNQGPASMNQGPASMNQGSASMNQGPASMNQAPGPMNQGQGPGSMPQGQGNMQQATGQMNQGPGPSQPGPGMQNQSGAMPQGMMPNFYAETAPTGPAGPPNIDPSRMRGPGPMPRFPPGNNPPGPGMMGPHMNPPPGMQPPFMHPARPPMGMNQGPLLPGPPPQNPNLQATQQMLTTIFGGTPGGQQAAVDQPPTLAADEIISEPVDPPKSSPSPQRSEDESKTDKDLSPSKQNTFDHLPPMQRELFMRIQHQQQQKESETETDTTDNQEANKVDDDNWYSSDEEEEKPKVADLANILKQISAKPTASAAIQGLTSMDVMQMLKAIKNPSSGDLSRSPSQVSVKTEPPDTYAQSSVPPIDIVSKPGEIPYKIYTITTEPKSWTLPPNLNLSDPRVQNDPRLQKKLKMNNSASLSETVKDKNKNVSRGSEPRKSTGDKSTSVDPRFQRRDSGGSKEADKNVAHASDPRLARTGSMPNSVGEKGVIKTVDPRRLCANEANNLASKKTMDPRVQRVRSLNPSADLGPQSSTDSDSGSEMLKNYDSHLQKSVSHQTPTAQSQHLDPRMQKSATAPPMAVPNVPVKAMDPRLARQNSAAASNVSLPAGGERPADPRRRRQNSSDEGRPPNDPLSRQQSDPGIARPILSPDIVPSPLTLPPLVDVRMPIPPFGNPRHPFPSMGDPRLPFPPMGDSRMPFPHMGNHRMPLPFLGDPRGSFPPFGEPRALLVPPGNPLGPGHQVPPNPLPGDPRALRQFNNPPPAISKSPSQTDATSQAPKFEHRNDPRFKRKTITTTAPSQPSNDDKKSVDTSAVVEKKKFTGQRKGSMEYSSPLGEETQQNNSGYNSYNRPQNRPVIKSEPSTAHPDPRKGHAEPRSSAQASPDHRGSPMNPRQLSDANIGLVGLPDLLQPPSMVDTMKVKDMFKTIDPTASPFC